MKDEKTPPRGRRAVGLLRSLGDRLKSDERAPYEVPEHDDVVDFNEPTGDIMIKRSEKSDEGKAQ